MTIADFGEQWTRYTTNDGYCVSLEPFRDICGPLVDPEDIKGATVADIVIGTGRIVRTLLEAGAVRVIAIEFSEVFTATHNCPASVVISIEFCPTCDRLPCLLFERGFEE